jgi:hypothetical protein
MLLSQLERDLAAEIDFGEVVLETIKQECQAQMQKLYFQQEVYLKDRELSCLNDILPARYLNFEQDIYGADNYAGSLLVEGLSAIVPPGRDRRQIFFRLKRLLASQGYITVCENKLDFSLKKRNFKRWIDEVVNTLLPEKLKIAVFQGEDPLDIIRIYQTNGWDYNVSPKDVIEKLKTWQEVSKFEIVFAGNSGFSIEFTELPEDLASFANDVYEFCPNVQTARVVIRELEKSKSLYCNWN